MNTHCIWPASAIFWLLLVSYGRPADSASQWWGLASQQSGVRSVVVPPAADTFVIKQTPEAFMGYNTILNLIVSTHYGFIMFDTYGVKEQLKRLQKGPFDSLDNLSVRLRFHVNWAQNPRTRVDLDRAFMARPKWSDASLKWSTTEGIELQYVDSTWTRSGASTVEFDVTRTLVDVLRECPGEGDCRYVSFRLSVPVFSWVQLLSKDHNPSEKQPALIFARDEYHYKARSRADTFVIRQEPSKTVGDYATVDMFAMTHYGFLEFDLAEPAALRILRNMHGQSRAVLRLFVEWAEQGGSTLSVYAVKLRQPMVGEELTFQWHHITNAKIGKFVGSEEAHTGYFIEYDVTTLVKSLARYKSSLRHFQLRLSTDYNSWIKVASRQHWDLSRRPAIVFQDATWWDRHGKQTMFVLQMLYFFLSPLTSLAVAIVLALMLHYSCKWYRRCQRSYGVGV